MYEANFEPVSNRADWIGTLQLVNDDTGAVITDLTGVTVLLEVKRRHCGPILSASLDNGKFSDLGGGVLQWRFTASDMAALCPDTYDVGITLTRDDITEQELVGFLPIIDGIVRR